MRMYGRLQPQQQGSVAQQQKPGAPAFGTLQKSEQKLENPYYYYGSTRNQKKQKQQVKSLKNRNCQSCANGHLSLKTSSNPAHAIFVHKATSELRPPVYSDPFLQFLILLGPVARKFDCTYLASEFEPVSVA